MLAKYRGRGLAYECIRCGKIDRHYRMVAHVWKHHIPLDRAPYHCTMCGFRSQDQQKLLDHVTKYAPHREEEAKRGKPRYEDVLRKAVNPVYITDQDLRPLGREESYQWYASNSRSSQVEDDDEVLSGLEEALNRVQKSGDSIPSSPESIKRSSLCLSQTGLISSARHHPSMLNVSTTMSAFPVAASSSGRRPEQLICSPSNLLPESSFTPIGIYQPTLTPVPLSTSVSAVEYPFNSSTESEPVFLSDQLPVYKPTPITKLRRSYQELPFDQPACGLSKKSAPVLPGIVDNIDKYPVNQRQSSAEPQKTSAAFESNDLFPLFGTRMSHPPEAVLVATPLQDEVLELTPDNNDPLMIEVTKQGKQTENSENITSAIVNGFKSIVDALNENTRAIRQQGKVFENVVGELSRIERKIASIERALNVKCSQPHPQPLVSNDENQPPSKRPKMRNMDKPTR